MTKVGFIVIVGAIVLVAFLVLAIINARKQWSYFNTPSEVFKQKLSKPRNWYKDRKKSYNQRKTDILYFVNHYGGSGLCGIILMKE